MKAFAKSAAMVASAFVLGLFLNAWLGWAAPPQMQPAGTPQLVSAARFQIFFSPHARMDHYLVDTQTGTVYQNVEYADLVGDPRVWEKMHRVDSDEEFLRLVETGVFHPKVKK